MTEESRGRSLAELGARFRARRRVDRRRTSAFHDRMIVLVWIVIYGLGLGALAFMAMH